MTDKKSQWSTDEKIRIVLQTFNPQASMAEICREHNLVPGQYTCGKKSFWPAAAARLMAPTPPNRSSGTKRRLPR